MQILAGDIGGTKVQLGLYTLKGTDLQLVRGARFAVGGSPGLEGIVRQFLGADHPSVACFGAPGPANPDRMTMANLPWVLDRRDLEGSLGIARVLLLNDIEALGFGTATLLPGQTDVLNAGNPSAHGTRCVLAAGTGLGAGFLTWDGNRHVAHPSEAGHTDFAPRTDDEVDLARYLRERHGGRVSIERVVSGQGLTNIYRFLRDVEGMDEPPWLAAAIAAVDDPNPVISRTAIKGRCPLCDRALDMFVSAYGSAAGDLALTTCATGGIYIAGGIAPAIFSKLKDGTFMRSFTAKGRLSHLATSMPVHVVLDTATALLGAIAYATSRLQRTSTVSQLAV